MSQLSGDLSRLEYSTFLGGWESDRLFAFHYRDAQTIWLAGSTISDDFPVTEDAFRSILWGPDDAFLLRFDLSDLAASEREMVTLPTELTLTNFPNPFNASTTFSLAIPLGREAKLEIFNLQGQLVFQRDLKYLRPGSHSVTFSAEGLPTGLYFARLEAGEQMVTRKMLLLR